MELIRETHVRFDICTTTVMKTLVILGNSVTRLTLQLQREKTL